MVGKALLNMYVQCTSRGPAMLYIRTCNRVIITDHKSWNQVLWMGAGDGDHYRDGGTHRYSASIDAEIR